METITPAHSNSIACQLQNLCINSSAASNRSTPSTTNHTPLLTPNFVNQHSNHQSAFLFPPPTSPQGLSSSETNIVDEHLYQHIGPDDDDDDEEQCDDENNNRQPLFHQLPARLGSASSAFFSQIIHSPSALISSKHSLTVSPKNDLSNDLFPRFASTLATNFPLLGHRSRSYHGPKQSNSSLQQIPSSCSFVRDAPKNLSTNSVAEIPINTNSQQLMHPFVPSEIKEHCLRELLETESNYVHVLKMITSCFIVPLENYFKCEEIQKIFLLIRRFSNYHSSFQADLLKAACMNNTARANSNPTTPTSINNSNQNFILKPTTKSSSQNFNCSSPTIASCFLSYKDKFAEYESYSMNLSQAQSYLDELKTRNELASIQLVRCENLANEGRFKLIDLLSLPIQRILKYHLLLAQLVKNSSKNNENYQELKRAYEAMVDLGQYINEVKRDNEALQIISKAEKSISDLNLPENTHLKDYGRLIADGYLKMKFSDDSKAKRYIFIFDKVMLICKAGRCIRGAQYAFKEALILSEYNIKSESPSACSTLSAKHNLKERWSFGFKLINSDGKTTYHFYAKTSDMRDEWLTAIHKSHENLHPQACRTGRASSHDFAMHTFEKASICNYCNRLFHGLLYQGYKCQRCSISLHKKCLDRPIKPCIVLQRYQQIDKYPWFCGQMNRESAQILLKNKPSETFLVRVSSKQNNSYVISLNFNSQVTHIRINMNENNQFYLSENRYFASLVDLITWYETNSLIENFHMLDARLTYPYKT